MWASSKDKEMSNEKTPLLRTDHSQRINDEGQGKDFEEEKGLNDLELERGCKEELFSDHTAETVDVAITKITEKKAIADNLSQQNSIATKSKENISENEENHETNIVSSEVKKHDEVRLIVSPEARPRNARSSTDEEHSFDQHLQRSAAEYFGGPEKNEGINANNWPSSIVNKKVEKFEAKQQKLKKVNSTSNPELKSPNLKIAETDLLKSEKTPRLASEFIANRPNFLQEPTMLKNKRLSASSVDISNISPADEDQFSTASTSHLPRAGLVVKDFLKRRSSFANEDDILPIPRPVARKPLNRDNTASAPVRPSRESGETPPPPLMPKIKITDRPTSLYSSPEKTPAGRSPVMTRSLPTSPDHKPLPGSKDSPLISPDRSSHDSSLPGSPRNLETISTEHSRSVLDLKAAFNEKAEQLLPQSTLLRKKAEQDRRDQVFQCLSEFLI